MDMTSFLSANPTPVVLQQGDDRYPEAVSRVLGKKAPEKLFCLGNIELLSRPSAGFCGSRKASERGLAVAEECSELLASEGFVVVSGYAAGVDLAAHRAALLAGGCTILVLPEGIANFRIRKSLEPYWDWNRVLVISQFEPSTGWKAYRAMERNTLLIALSRAMVVIEAGPKGGTLHAGQSTLKFALPLFVVQYGDMFSQAQGNLELLKAGGRPLRKNGITGRPNLNYLIAALRNPIHPTSSTHLSLPLA